MKRVVIGAVVFVFILGTFVGWNVFKYQSHLKSMRPLETGQLNENLFVVKDQFVNAYFLKGKSGKYIAIDAGISSEAMQQELTKCGIDTRDVVAVFLTHTDYDHAGGVALFSNAKVYISTAEEEMINGSTARGPLMKNKLAVNYTLLKEGAVQKVDGVKVSPLLTPGHTKGSTCYIVNDSLLFTGDLFSLEGNRAHAFIPDFNMDTEHVRASMKKIQKLKGIRAHYTGHFGRTTEIEWEE